MKPVMTEKVGKFTIKIFQDLDPMNPRTEWDNLGTIYHTHRSYDLGVRESVERMQEILADPNWIALPVFMYEHSGVMLKTKPFSCPWDPGQVGIIAVEKSKVLKDWNRKKWSLKLQKLVLKNLEGEVQVFSDYLEGRVYGYHIEDDQGGIVDYCWGFFGDPETCMKQAKENLE